MAASMPIPKSLLHIKPYMARADEVHGSSPLSGHALRHFAVEIGVKTKAEDARAYLFVMMDILEEERKLLMPSNKDILEALRSLAVDLIHKARANDQPKTEPSTSDEWSNRYAAQVAKAFHAAAVLIDAMRLHTALSPDLKEAQMYALLRSVELAAKLARNLFMEPCIDLDWKPASASLLPTPPPSPLPPSASERAAQAKVPAAAAQQPAQAAQPVQPAEAVRPGASATSTPAGDSDAPVFRPIPSPDAPLPTGWEERTDPKTGRKFYVNLVDKTTSWRRPADAADGAAQPASAAGATVPAPAPAATPSEAVLGGTVARTPDLSPEEEAAISRAEAEAAAEADAAEEAESAAADARAAQAAGEVEATVASMADEMTRIARLGAEADARVQHTEAELDSIWSVLGRDLTKGVAPGGSAGDAGPAQPARTAIVPPPEGASREEVKAYRAALRKAAAENVRRTYAENRKLMADYAEALRRKEAEAAATAQAASK